jgi:hypothetical protein
VSANFSFTNKRNRQLEKPTEPEEIIKPEDAGDTTKLSQLLQRILKKLTELGRRWAPHRLDFEDLVVAGSDVSPETIRLTHMFDGPVRWWVVNTRSGGTIALPYIQESHEVTTGVPLSDRNTLVLDVYYEATLTIRVEEAGA